MQPPILEARGLTKRYGKTRALAGLDLVVNPGRVVALLGPNGAGKSTFVRAVATLLRPDAGTLYVNGTDALRRPAKVRQVVGLAGQFAAVEEAMTGRENLRMVGRLFGLSRQEAKAAANRVLDQMQLTDDADRLWVSSLVVAGRMVRKFARTPQLIVFTTVQSALFLLMFRFAFGGAIGTGGALSYVNFLVPGFIASSVRWSGMGAATGVAEDVEHGFVDRLRSLPIPRGGADRPQPRRHRPADLGARGRRDPRFRRRAPRDRFPRRRPGRVRAVPGVRLRL